MQCRSNLPKHPHSANRPAPLRLLVDHVQRGRAAGEVQHSARAGAAARAVRRNGKMARGEGGGCKNHRVLPRKYDLQYRGRLSAEGRRAEGRHEGAGRKIRLQRDCAAMLERASGRDPHHALRGQQPSERGGPSGRLRNRYPRRDLPAAGRGRLHERAPRDVQRLDGSPSRRTARSPPRRSTAR